MQVMMLYITAILIWGTTWIAISFQLDDIAPEVSLAYRFTIASALLFIFCKLRKLNLSYNKQQHMRMFGLGISMFGVNFYLLYSGQHLLNSALAAIAFATLVVMNIINSKLFFNTPVSSREYFGSGLGLTGICILFWPEISVQNLNSEGLIGLGLCLLGTFVASLSNMLSISNHRHQLPIIQTNAYAMGYGAISMALLGIVKGTEFRVDMPIDYWLAMAYLAVFGSVIVFGCYLTLLGKIGANKTAYITIVTPAIAVGISSVVEGFTWTIYTFCGISLILFGNVIVLLKVKPVATINNKTAAQGS